MKDQEKKEKKEKRPKKKRSLIGRIIVFLLAVLALAGLLAMAMSVLCSYVDPTKFVWLTFFGLMFWAILFFNLVVFALLLLLWSRKVWISVIALLVALPGIYKSFSTGVSQNGGELRVMSYNVLQFKDQYDEEKRRESVAYDMVNMIKEYQPDVLCLQEFSPFRSKISRKDCIVQYGEMMGLPYTYWHEKAHFGGNVIFSKYPLYALEEDIPFAKENEYGAVARVDAGPKGVFYVVNCHLTSFQLTRDELTVFSERNNNKEQMEEYGKSIVSKLVNAYKKRSQEVNEMLAHIPHDGRPILLCGDFNDTPLSYTYQQIHGAGFIDGFVKAGHGIGRTYAGKLPLLRIDYIWANEQIQPMSFKRIKYKGSDHFPVMLDFNVNHGL
jgi:endonuclease/exonuclease/phosphatase (EEP) superfamily protein YafD